MLICGCSSGSNKTTTTSATQPDGPQTYMAPSIVGETSPRDSVSLYSIDDTVLTFTQSNYLVGADSAGLLQQGEQTWSAGTTTTLARGLISLGTTISYAVSSGVLIATLHNPPVPGGWAFELPDQAGALVQTVGQPFAPLAPATSCPTKSQTYQFLTLPAPIQIPDSSSNAWDPTQEAGFGSVEVSGSGSTINFESIHQFTLPQLSADGTTVVPPGAPATEYIAASSQTGACSATYYGNTTVVPAGLSVSNPILGSDSPAPPVALVAIGPTGLLVESNAANGEQNQSPTPPLYQNLLGAGTGAIGLPKPSSALVTSTLVGAQYLGFVYGTGSGGAAPPSGSNTCESSSSGWSTCVASFGFANVPQNCNNAYFGVPATSTNVLFGGDFAGDNPYSAQSTGGFGQCDIAIDLGTQDPNNNGNYPTATVYLGAVFGANGQGITDTFPAVAIAGQLGGKNALFVLGVDSINGTPYQAWGIYLFQSN